MNSKLIISTLLSLLILGCSASNKIESPQKSIHKSNNYIFAEGRWKAMPGTRKGIIPKINFTSITCNLNDMTAREIIAYVNTPQEQSLLQADTLYTNEFYYQIIDFTDGVIRAKREAPVADISITISLKDNYAEKSFRETKARGSETANPDVAGKWTLE